MLCSRKNDCVAVAGSLSPSRTCRSTNSSRRAFAVLPVIFSQTIDSLWLNVVIIGVATAAHQAFSANLFTLPSDLFPRNAVGSVIGIGGTVGAIGGMIMAKYAGFVLDSIGSYTPLFGVAGSAYFLALAAVHFLSPRLARAELGAA